MATRYKDYFRRDAVRIAITSGLAEDCVRFRRSLFGQPVGCGL